MQVEKGLRIKEDSKEELKKYILRAVVWNALVIRRHSRISRKDCHCLDKFMKKKVSWL